MAAWVDGADLSACTAKHTHKAVMTAPAWWGFTDNAHNGARA